MANAVAARGSLRSALALIAAALVSLALPGISRAAKPTVSMSEATALRVTGMTFVGSRGGVREVVLRSRTASLRPADNVAELNEVSAHVSEDAGGRSFSMTCARVELDIATNDFLAEGDVRGETGDGQRYSAPWVRYEHDGGLLFTDAPVEMNDSTGRFRGDGFRYYVEEKRFELLGNVRVEQLP